MTYMVLKKRLVYFIVQSSRYFLQSAVLADQLIPSNIRFTIINSLQGLINNIIKKMQYWVFISIV